MRKVLYSLLCMVALSAGAQDSTLKEYVGKYIFPGGSIVPSAEVYLNGSELTVNSVQGSSVMQKVARDTFALISFDGMAFYSRNKAGQVSGVKVIVGDFVLDGVKEGVTAFIHRNRYFIATRWQVVK
ncbi:MAG: hypothetical protein ACO1NX_09220 [Chitinophagaceae bacterium]